MTVPASGSGGHEAEKPAGGTFGVDAPKVPVILGAAALLLVILGCVLMITNRFAPGVVSLIFASFLGLCALSYLYTNLQGNFVWWDVLLYYARLKGD
jgi:hypothetical protein